MMVRFWGTRGSIATPGPDTNHFGGNTSCVELTTDSGDLLIFDCGTGARPLGTHLMETYGKPIRATILLSHTHWDHIQGFPFFLPIFEQGNEIAVYAPEGGNRSLHSVLAGQMEFTYFPIELTQLPAALTYHDLAEGTHQIGGVRIVAQYLNHPAMTLGYRIEADGAVVVYLCDHEPFAETLWHSCAESGHLETLLHEGDRRHVKFMAGADLVIHDAQFTPEQYPSKKNWGHSSYKHVVEMGAAVGIRQLALTHHDPNHDDAFVAGIEREARILAERYGGSMEIFCAYEGCEVSVSRQAVSQEFDESFTSSISSSHGLHILIVDDDEEIRQLVKQALMHWEFMVSEATNGLDALRMVQELRPHLVLLDLVMPKPDGLEVLKLLRTKPETATLPILILTGQDDEDSIRTGFSIGATDYLTKPFKIPQLIARIRACLARGVK